MQDPGPFLRGSHKGGYGTLEPRSAATAALMTARTWVAGAPRAWARARATARATTYQRGSRRLAGP